MDDRINRLSPRQRELLTLVGEGITASKELSQRVGLAPRTIDNFLSQASKTLGAENREDAAARFRQLQENCHDACHVTSEDLVSDPENKPLGGTGSGRGAIPALREFLFGLPFGGPEHSLKWDEVSLQILRVAFLGLLSLTALVIFVLAFFRTFG